MGTINGDRAAWNGLIHPIGSRKGPPSTIAMISLARLRPVHAPAWLLGVLLTLGTTPALAASPLLDSIKQNPQLARSLCSALRQLNSQGQSALSSEGIALVASRQGLSPMDAEIVATYVVGLYCPDVR